MPTADPESPVPTRSRSRLTSALVAFTAIVSTLSFGALFAAWMRIDPADDDQILKLALDRFIDGDRVIAGRIAEQAEIEADNDPDGALRSLQSFLVGAGQIARGRQDTSGSERRRMLREAIPHLRSSQSRGFPPGRQAEGDRLLGESLHELGRYGDAVEPFRRAIDRDRTLGRSLIPRLAESLVRSPERRADEALEWLESYQQDLGLLPAERREAWLARVEALVELTRWQEAERSIGQAEASAADGPSDAATSAFRDRLKWLRGFARARRIAAEIGQDWRSPPATWPKRDGRDLTAAEVDVLDSLDLMLTELQQESDSRTAARAQLLKAQCHLLRGDPDAALVDLMLARQQRPLAAEGVAAGIIEIELLADRGSGRETVQAVNAVIRELGDVKGYDGGLVSYEDFKARLLAALQQLQRRGEYESAIDIARLLPPLFGVGQSLVYEAEAFRAWAADTAAAERRRRKDIPAAVAARVRDRYRAAGDAFAQAAELKFDQPDYVPLLWSAIEAYQAGNHFRRSLTLLEPYLRYEERSRKPRGLVALGRGRLAEGDPANLRRAIRTLDECVAEYPRDPLRYDARLLAAKARGELGEFEEARTLLLNNLRDGELAPASPIWQDSLLSLGELLAERLNDIRLRADHSVDRERRQMLTESRPIIDDAVRTLGESLERYWPGGAAAPPPRRVLHAAYLAAQTHRLAAQLPLLEAESAEMTAVDRRRSRLASAGELRAALDHYRRLRGHLEARIEEGNDEGRLPPFESTLLRNALVGEADTLFELNQFDEAAIAYSSITMRHMNEPLALEGILGHAQCLRRLGRDQEADSRIRQASLVLRRIPDEWNDRFQEVTRYSRNEWGRFLDWMNGRIRTPNA